jgi:hypothetical protein
VGVEDGVDRGTDTGLVQARVGNQNLLVCASLEVIDERNLGISPVR